MRLTLAALAVGVFLYFTDRVLAGLVLSGAICVDFIMSPWVAPMLAIGGACALAGAAYLLLDGEGR